MIELTNDFHNTRVQVRKIGAITQATYRRIFNALCGQDDCMCGVDSGTQEYRLTGSKYEGWEIEPWDVDEGWEIEPWDVDS